MRLVYKFVNYHNNDRLLELCHVSKDLYNQTLYTYNQRLDSSVFTTYMDLDSIMKDNVNLEGNINYRLLKAQVSQQCIKNVDKDMKSYFKSCKEYKKNPEKFNGVPQKPRYKKKNGYHQLVYTNQCSKIKNGKIYFSKSLWIDIPQYEKYKSRIDNFDQIRVNPKNGYTEIEIVYDINDDNEKINNIDYSRYASIDLGISNLVTLVTDFNRPIIYSGGQIKSINRFFNKIVSKSKSILETNNNKKSSKKIRRLYEKRDRQLNDIYHKVSRDIANFLFENGVGNLIIGYNEGWKDSINLGSVTNQNFTQISYRKLITCLEYKCEVYGINVITNEESYTSKCDSLAFEPIEKHNQYLGERIKRGLFKSSTGVLINADVNGSVNIMRKVVGDSTYIWSITHSGLLFRPIKRRNIYNLNVETVY